MHKRLDSVTAEMDKINEYADKVEEESEQLAEKVLKTKLIHRQK